MRVGVGGCLSVCTNSTKTKKIHSKPGGGVAAVLLAAGVHRNILICSNHPFHVVRATSHLTVECEQGVPDVFLSLRLLGSLEPRPEPTHRRGIHGLGVNSMTLLWMQR